MVRLSLPLSRDTEMRKQRQTGADPSPPTSRRTEEAEQSSSYSSPPLSCDASVSNSARPFRTRCGACRSFARRACSYMWSADEGRGGEGDGGGVDAYAASALDGAHQSGHDGSTCHSTSESGSSSSSSSSSSRIIRSGSNWNRRGCGSCYEVSTRNDDDRHRPISASAGALRGAPVATNWQPWPVKTTLLLLLMPPLLLLLPQVASVAPKEGATQGSSIIKYEVEGKGRCLDGSLPAYYWRQGHSSGADKWIVYLPGGGWCVAWRDCVARAVTRFGSSQLWPAAQPPQSSQFAAAQASSSGIRFDGMLSSDPHKNPDFYNWNMVMVVYCDGGAYLGQHGRIYNNGSRIFAQGRVALKAVVEDLMWKRGLWSASMAVLAGCSAGGQSIAVSTCDWFARQLLPTTKTRCIADAAMFLDKRDDLGGHTFRSLMIRMMSLHWSFLSFNRQCRRANRGKQWRCLFPQYALQYLRTPIFIINNLYDYAALTLLLHRTNTTNGSNATTPANSSSSSGSIVGSQGPTNNTDATPWLQSIIPCLRRDALKFCSVRQRRFILLLGSAVRKTVQGIVAMKARRGMRVGSFLVKGAGHCSLVTPRWHRQAVRGRTLRQAVTQWLMQ